MVSAPVVIHFYRTPALSTAQKQSLLEKINTKLAGPILSDVESEFCFNVEISSSELSKEELSKLTWLLSETFEPDQFGSQSFLQSKKSEGELIEVGPRLNFKTAWCTNALSIFDSCGLGDRVTRIERSRRFLFKTTTKSSRLTKDQRDVILSMIHDRMTECEYVHPLTTYDATGTTQNSISTVFEIPIMQEGRAALERINNEMGFAFDACDLDFYTDLFLNELKRNPTNVECFDLAQSNSEHSRHWFFRGKLIIDGEPVPEKSLFKMVQGTLAASIRNFPEHNNSVIAFCDNSSAIEGYDVTTIAPEAPGNPSRFIETKVHYDPLFTAETHNFPSGIAPFPGAETGAGGRIRDVHATGRGARVIAGTAGYCVGQLLIPDRVAHPSADETHGQTNGIASQSFHHEWEDKSFQYPPNMASPLQIIIEASNGASDYGNKFGEPLIQGFTRSFGLRTPDGARREWVKPIMFSGGIGQIDARHLKKEEPKKGMLVVKVGGPAYRIGMGGGAASSMVQGENAADLDFNAVQRGDAEMENKLNRALVACVELGDKNPICSLSDQGAGGSANVIKELVAPEGAKVNIRDFVIGDKSLSVLEIWGAEYQEQDAILIKEEHKELFSSICAREKVPVAYVGTVTGDGRMVLVDSENTSGPIPVNLPLDKVLGDMPQKTFEFKRVAPTLVPLQLPTHDGDVSAVVSDALSRVLKLLSVGSKRFLTTKVDRSVTGLIARQQCVGPLEIPLADVAVTAQSHYNTTGAAIAIGEQPIKGLIHPGAMARMTVGETLTNLMWAPITAVEDVKCSGNWMYAAKLEGEGSHLYDACKAMCTIMEEIGLSIDGGKDSLSMAAKCRKGPNTTEEEIVKSPGELVVSAYVTCPDITKVVTPDFKYPGKGLVLHLKFSRACGRLGASALAQVYGQIGEHCPDVDDSALLKAGVNAVQELIRSGLVRSGHDISDGGAIVALLEMCFAGNCGVTANFTTAADNVDAVAYLFAEELGAFIEVLPEDQARVAAILNRFNIPFDVIGTVQQGTYVNVSFNGKSVLSGVDMRDLRDKWEETSFELCKLQGAAHMCVEQERTGLRNRKTPPYKLSFVPEPTADLVLQSSNKMRVAIIREEGSNGDRDMTAAFHLAGFEPWDIHMTDLIHGRIVLDERFRGVAFVGGFSYGDVLDSAKGWAGSIRFNKSLSAMFEQFLHGRSDTFSLGVCNGCQLVALLGGIPYYYRNKETQERVAEDKKPRFIHNEVGKFESRFSTVKILESPAVMLRGMHGSTIGIWVAHGEGKAYFPDRGIYEHVLRNNLAPVRYVNDDDEPTEEYPFNPNGSPQGIAALCSEDGRHLCIMPHPERTVLKWQWAWMPEEWKSELRASPWLRMFQNARTWCEEQTTSQ